MSTLRAGDREFHTLPAGHLLTVVAAAASAGLVRQYPDSGFNALSPATAVGAGATVTVGPFTGSVRLGVEAKTGTVTWEAGPAEPAGDWRSDQTAAGQALVSKDGVLMPGSVAFAWGGQSLEGGSTLEPDSKGTARRAYLHAPSQGYYEPDPLNKGASGSYLTPVIQRLGINDKLRVFGYNCAMGGSSAIRDWCGVLEVNGWQANVPYRGARTTLGNGDPGTRGELILESGRIWECTTGCTHLAFYDSITPQTVGGTVWRTNLTFIAKNTDRTSANAKPTFSGTAIVGDTVTDNGTGALGGGLVWTCRVVSAPAADADGIRVLRIADYGFDPYYALERAANALLAAPVSSDRRFFGFSNATGDAQLRQRSVAAPRVSAANVTSLYARAHSLICQYMINPARGIRTIHWGSLFYPDFTAADFNALEEALYGVASISTPSNHPASLLYTYLVTNSGYTTGVPGGVIGQYYMAPSLYRLLGTSVAGLLQAPSGNPHPTLVGNLALADAIYPFLRQVLLDVAT